MLKAILGQIFVFFIVASLLHGIYSIIYFLSRRLEHRPRARLALKLIWPCCVLFFSVNYISSLSKNAEGIFSSPRNPATSQVQAAQAPLKCYSKRAMQKICSTDTYIEDILFNSADTVQICTPCKWGLQE
jgi:hypothetical protein